MSEEHDGGFGVRLRQHREAAGLTQEQLAERAGLTPNAISALERGERRRPYPQTVRALVDALGLTAEQARPTAGPTGQSAAEHRRRPGDRRRDGQ